MIRLGKLQTNVSCVMQDKARQTTGANWSEEKVKFVG